jgi:hypothetical protein
MGRFSTLIMALQLFVVFQLARAQMDVPQMAMPIVPRGHGLRLVLR